MPETVELSKPIATICAHLGVDPEAVARITLEPMSAEVLLYHRDENGKKHIHPDTGRAAMERRTFKIRVPDA